MPKIIVQPGQSLLDIAVKHYGTAEGVFDLVCRNRLNGLTQNIYPGDELDVAEVPQNLRVARFLEPHAVATIEDLIRGHGIGYEPLVTEGAAAQPYHFKVAEAPLTRVAFEVSDADAPAGITYAQGRFWIINSHGDLSVLAYTSTGVRAAATFSAEPEPISSGAHRGIAFADDHLFILTHYWLRAYCTDGTRAAEKDISLGSSLLATGVYFDSQKIYTATRSGRPRLLVFDADGTLLEEGFTLSQRATVAGIAVARGHIYKQLRLRRPTDKPAFGRIQRPLASTRSVAPKTRPQPSYGPTLRQVGLLL